MALIIGLGELRLPAKRDSPDDHTGLRIDGGRIIGAPVHSEDTSGLWFIADRVRVLTSLGLANDFQCFQIENRDVISSAIADETAVERRHNLNTVHTRRFRDIADNFAGVWINNNSVSSVRNVKAAALAIHFQIVPAPFASDFDLLDHMVTGCGTKHRERGGSK